MKKTRNTTLLLGSTLFLAACAGPNVVLETPVLITEVSGFWGGLWHGFVLPFSFLGSLVTDYISIYEVKNSGGWYDLGFVLGVSAWHSARRAFVRTW